LALYDIVFARSARKELESINNKIVLQILRKIEKLSVNPRSLGSLKLKGEKDLWRIRIGDYRVVYSIDDIHKIVDISLIRHRKDVYR
jgi:mRNA interferase RelE/StbE